MSTDLQLVLGLLTACMVLFVVGKPRLDVVGLLVIAALPCLGILSVSETLAGFSDSNVVLIGALFVVGEALVRTGIVFSVGDRLVGVAGGDESKLTVLLMVSVATLGAFMSSTGIVAIFIPIVLRMATQLRISPSRLMMPLSFAGLISGMMTLVATPPNMIVDGVLKREGYAGFSFLSFTPIGLAVLATGVGYMLIARRLLQGVSGAKGPNGTTPTVQSLVREYGLENRVSRFRIPDDSPLVGRELRELNLRGRFGLNIIAIERRTRFYTDSINPIAHTRLHAHDILFVSCHATTSGMTEFSQEFGPHPMALRGGSLNQRFHEVGMAEVLVPPESNLVGRSVVESEFRRKHRLHVIGLRRSGKPVDEPVSEEKLKMGDVMLVIGPWKAIRGLKTEARNALVLTLPAEAEQSAPAFKRAPYAVACIVLMIALMISGIVPNVVAAIITCLLLGLCRCIDMESAYKAIHWPSIVLIAGMIPLATALEKTGGVDMATNLLVEHLGSAGPTFLLASLFVFTATIGLFISNTATAALMAPVAISVARHLGAAPQPFAMVVAIASSAAFMAPISSPVNMLVMGPGRYRFGDYVKVGVPFTVVVLAITLLLVPRLFPLFPG